MPDSIVLKFNNNKSGRYYCLCIYKDLLGDWIVSRHWGGLQKNNFKCSVIDSYGACIELMQQFIKRRLSRGYSL